MCRPRSPTLLVIALAVLITPSSHVRAQNPALSSTADLPEPVIQSNHAGEIRALVASPSGELVASGSVDGTVKLWSQRTGLMIQTISVSPSWVRSLTFSADSRRLAVGMGDHLIYLYDIPSGTLLRSLRGADSAVVAIAFSRDGALLAASTTRDNKVYVWRTDEGRVLATIPRPARALRFMPDTGWLLVTDGTGTSEWSIEASGRASALSGALDSASSSAVLAPLQSTGSPPTAVDGWGRMIAQARGAVVQWSPGAIDEPSRYPPISTASLRAVRFSPDDRVMVTTSNTGDVAVWDLESGALSQYLRDAAGATAAFASAVAFSGDGGSITAVRGDSRAHWTWQLSSLTPLTLPPRTDKDNGFTADYFSEAGADIGKPSPPMPPHFGIVGSPEEFVTTRAILARSGDTAIYAGFTTPTFVRYVTAVNLRTRAALWIYNVPATQRGRNIGAVAATPDGALVTVAFDDGTVTWLDGASGSLRHAEKSPTERGIAVLEYSPGGDLLAGSNQLGELVLWRRDGTLLPSPPRRAANVLALAFSQDNRLLASGGVDNTIQLWDIANARVIRTLVGHTSAVTALGFAHRSDILVSGSEDSTLRVWSARSGELLAAASAVANGDWLTVSPEGFFDGTRGGWNAVPFRFKSAPTTLYRPEQFFKQFYQPGLLAEVVARQQPVLALLRERRDSRASLDISKLRSSRPPVVALKMATARASNARTVDVAVSVRDGGSGMRDLRIFRNQSLVRFVHGPLGQAMAASTHRLKSNSQRGLTRSPRMRLTAMTSRARTRVSAWWAARR
jgi:WD40 repeat protein